MVVIRDNPQHHQLALRRISQGVIIGTLFLYVTVWLPNMNRQLTEVESVSVRSRLASGSIEDTLSQAPQMPVTMKDKQRVLGYSSNGFELETVDVDSGSSKKGYHEKGLKIIWLMSFPNSGTSYTTKLIRHLSLTHSGSNYGHDNVGNGGKPIPVFDEQPMGPFWTDPTVHPEYNFPMNYVLVKTHCGGRCISCPPAGYSETLYSFRRKCLLSTRSSQNEDGTKVLEEAPYPTDRIRKAIHLIRSPFDNIVSRVHNTDSSISTPESFRRYCFDYNRRYAEDERASMLFSKDLLDLTANVPCRADFFRYVEWHNQAFALHNDMALEALVVYYESYTSHFGETATQLLDFVQLDARAEAEPFVQGKTYHDGYFTQEERRAVKVALEMLSTKTTWDHIRQYFDV